MRSREDWTTVSLKPGGRAHALVLVLTSGSLDESCFAVPSDGLRVFPPSSEASVIVPYQGQACAAMGDGVPTVNAVVSEASE